MHVGSLASWLFSVLSGHYFQGVVRCNVSSTIWRNEFVRGEVWIFNDLRGRPLWCVLFLLLLMLQHGMLLRCWLRGVANFGFRSSLQAHRAETMVDGLPRASTSGEKNTFCLIALDPENRLRYPLVSLLFDIRWWFWLRRGVWENLFDVRFFGIKVGS